MKTLVVDDSRLAAAALARVVARVDAGGICQSVYTAADALAACRAGGVDVAFLDIEMPGINGLELARQLRREAPTTNVVFVTGFPEYALDAWKTQASSFLVKPADEQDVRNALAELRFPLHPASWRGLFVRCFGNFEVFCDGKPVEFERRRAKELLAYLVDRRGSMVTMGELMAVLWEDLPDTASRRSQLRTLISGLRRTMGQLGYDDVIVRRRGDVAVSLSPEECDYYGYLQGLPSAINSFNGEYLCQYSWAEETLAQLMGS